MQMQHKVRNDIVLIANRFLPRKHKRLTNKLQFLNKPRYQSSCYQAARALLTFSVLRDVSTGNFSSVTSEFVLSRQFWPFLLDIYIPGVVFVFTSWLSLWMEVRRPIRQSVHSV